MSLGLTCGSCGSTDYCNGPVSHFNGSVGGNVAEDIEHTIADLGSITCVSAWDTDILRLPPTGGRQQWRPHRDSNPVGDCRWSGPPSCPRKPVRSPPPVESARPKSGVVFTPIEDAHCRPHQERHRDRHPSSDSRSPRRRASSIPAASPRPRYAPNRSRRSDRPPLPLPCNGL